LCITYVGILFSFAFGYRNIFYFVSFLISVLYFFYDFWKKLFSVFVEIDDDVFFITFFFCSLHFFPWICKIRGIHKEFYIIKSVGFYFVNSLHISCEDAFRSFDDAREKESVYLFFRQLYPSHEITWLGEAGEE
jgi:hypothetical protein